MKSDDVGRGADLTVFGKAEVQHRLRDHLLALLGLTLAAYALFSHVLETGFWSPEDLGQLYEVATSQARGEWPLVFRPALAGGYPANPAFRFEFYLFGLDSKPYYIVNLATHILNSFFAYLLVNTLLHDRKSAFLSALLFALSVGSYGKNLMFATGISSLLYAMAVLLGTLFYVLNEKRNEGKPLGAYAFGFFAIFLVSLFMRGGAFSLLASFAFYNIFFLQERGRRILHVNIVACLVLASVSLLLSVFVLRQNAIGSPVDTAAFLRNLPAYLVLMVFPLNQSELLETAPALVRGIYSLAPYIRPIVGLAILSISLFGFVFGNRAIRFYIAWMYVMLVPFAVLRYPAGWLNIRFLYLVSLGFCVLLASGSLYARSLLEHRGWRRNLPFVIPIVYIALSIALVIQLNFKNQLAARHPNTQASLAQISALLEP